MSDVHVGEQSGRYTPAGRPAAGGVKSLWQGRLRSCVALSEQREKQLPLSREDSESSAVYYDATAPSSLAVSGLTDTTMQSAESSIYNSLCSRGQVFSSGSSSNRTRRRLRAAAKTAERHREEELQESHESVSRVLFSNYLLEQLEPQDGTPVLTVVFDLDETLVSNRNVGASGAILRPYCLHMLNALRYMKGIEVVLWTASTKETAMPVVKQLCQSGTVFDDVIYRNNVWFTEPLHTKDLRLLGRNMDRLLIFDNAPNCLKFNPQNAVITDDFRGNVSGGDATLVNVYYIVERVYHSCITGMTVPETLLKTAEENFLCSSVILELPLAWKMLPLSEIPPLKIPPHGHFFRAHSAPLDESIMKHWVM
ncbi:putative NLI interacting factor like phosphatase [Trypanosoma vivax]|uniref:Mitochondrial import inner membrane translocase subunit TIM50 n=1 Tax=Trypanosoma vivax (strain Y486) TaxID=1055687 RepID=G0UB44_TRYVY|nr:putative TFIIF-stimulated CTD phosphatase [Trypanosoma vivax]KAH8606278.1 putative NLI interacting factor like phosphatase [Trypanosoma vivax]CCC53031.1 putative TFIIF-stimulated CTD phosphatase [Trypanosoma vivax Y486]